MGLRKADLDRIFKALKDAGHTVGTVEIRAGGDVVITAALTDGAGAVLPADVPVDDLAAFRARKNARRASQGAE